MSRKNIFEILASELDLAEEIPRIDKLVCSERSFNCGNSWSTIEGFIDIMYFYQWTQRKRCINCQDMRNALGIDEITRFKSISIDDAIIYLEYVANLIELYLNIQHRRSINPYDFSKTFFLIKGNVFSLLDDLDFQVEYFEDEEKAIIIPKNAAATAVAEIVDHKTAYKVIHYNHHLLKGDLVKKKDILLALGNEFEPMGKELNKKYSQISDDVSFLLNNMNIRHNNKEEGKNYKEYVAKMSNEELENWYDETYQTLLLAILANDHIERTKKIKELKDIQEKK